MSNCMLKSHSLVKFSALFSGPDGRFLLVGCDSYITPLVTRTSSCFLQPRLKVNLSGGEALSIQSSASSAPRRRTHAVSLSLSLLHSLYVSHSCSHSRG
ncbi:E3 ubiquitin-protein ligase complex SLX5-SLX8 subunit SLX5 [Dissostichus eleginoides]|uniref:E3 ubiquitin-protein ligase complex SLX5-SLX8 subunit SLX5 n=1 Tax=Dissostichus eleginoides TaxID=100907 RepID=A0AAD9F4X3_DISEL|nr:E3 ubiquitin-protein ligase complex SLX5-SLX8 subunit SLX5 [Dissostichus eleginoides]